MAAGYSPKQRAHFTKRRQSTMSDIQPGERFRDAAASMIRGVPEWIVERIFVGTDGKEYAEVRSSLNANDGKSLSTAVLRDKRRFVRIQPI